MQNLDPIELIVCGAGAFIVFAITYVIVENIKSKKSKE